MSNLSWFRPKTEEERKSLIETCLILAALAVFFVSLHLALEPSDIAKDEVAMGQRWYVSVPGRHDLIDYYVSDVTEETVEFIDENDQRTRYELEEVRFVELHPQLGIR